MGISIHVPAWGTTKAIPDSLPSSSFQSTFPRGERRSTRFGVLGNILFQSTFPRGERRLSPGNTNLLILISIHVPAWGTTASAEA